jgi:hypothetical protein
VWPRPRSVSVRPQSLLQEPQCLRCGSALPLKLLWDFVRVNDKHVLPGLKLLTRSGLLRGNIGIKCPNCGSAFRVVQARIRIAFALVWALLLGTAAYLEDWTSHPHVPVAQQRPLAVVLLLVLAFVSFLLLRIYTPRLALLRPPRDGEKLTFPLHSAYERQKL